MAQNQSQRKKQVRFSINDDLNLLKEVLAEIPFRNKAKWSDIAVHVSRTPVFTIDSRRARERTDLLVEKFKKEDREALKKSGTKEESSEMTTMLQDIVDLIAEETSNKDDIKVKVEADEQKAKDMRKRAMESLKKDNEDCTPNKRATNSNVLAYLREKNVAEQELRSQELQVRRQELDIQKERLTMEREDRNRQTEMMMEMIKLLKKIKTHML